MKLDSDSEEEQDGVKAEPITPPRKRSRLRMEVSGLVKKLEMPGKSHVAPVKLPEIKIQAPTPRKGQDAEEWDMERPMRPRLIHGGSSYAVNDSDEAYDGIEQLTDEEAKPLIEEGIVPSPATEDEPPAFPVERTGVTTSHSGSSVEHGEDIQNGIDEVDPRHDADDISVIVASPTTDHGAYGGEYSDGPMRTIHPVSTFDSITLWTPDAPLAGFRPDELSSIEITDRSNTSLGPKSSSASLVPTEVEEDSQRTLVGSTADDSQATVVPTSSDTAQLEANGTSDNDNDGEVSKSLDLAEGWWRIGGAGEGGDEFVRGMGEWLGLVQMVRYLSEDFNCARLMNATVDQRSCVSIGLAG